ncbi:hypothetical protein H8958_017306, partial [Nasalis larvatus]
VAAQRFSSRLLPQSESMATLTSPVAVLAALRRGSPMRVLDLDSGNLAETEIAGWDSRFREGMGGKGDASLQAEWRARRRRMVQETATRRPARPASYRDSGSNPPPFLKRPGSRYLAGKGRSRAKLAGHVEAAGTRGCRERRWHRSALLDAKAGGVAKTRRTARRALGTTTQGRAPGPGAGYDATPPASLREEPPTVWSQSAVAKTEAVVPVTRVALGGPRLRAANERLSKRRYFAGILVY